MKKCLLVCFPLLLAWLIFSAFQPAIIVGESDNWKVVYKPRKGTEADSIAYPWTGKIKWRHMFSEPQIESVDLWIDNKYVNDLDKDAAKKGNGNFNGRVIKDSETFYDGPDNSIKGMRITWQENGEKHTESFKFKRKKRLLVIPLLISLL